MEIGGFGTLCGMMLKWACSSIDLAQQTPALPALVRLNGPTSQHPPAAIEGKKSRSAWLCRPVELVDLDKVTFYLMKTEKMFGNVWQIFIFPPWKLQVGEKKVALLRIMLKIVWEQRWRERRVRLSDGFPNSLWSQAVEDSHPRENFAAERRAEIQLAQIENSGFGGPGALGPSMAWRMD